MSMCRVIFLLNRINMEYDVEKVKPYNDDQSKREQVTEMFDGIAGQYDLLNRVLSLGIDTYWRKEALKAIIRYKPKQILDVATGTGDFAIMAQRILNPDRITATDISEGMMDVGREKVLQKGLQDNIIFELQDCSNLSYYDNTFDAVTAAFGVRNFEEINKSFQEVLRVLRPGGVFMFIELSTPEKKPMKGLYDIYTKYAMPTMAKLLSTEERAYEYLPESISVFPQGREMMLILQKNGFTNIRLRRLTLGITTMYIAEKPL